MQKFLSQTDTVISCHDARLRVSLGNWKGHRQEVLNRLWFYWWSETATEKNQRNWFQWPPNQARGNLQNILSVPECPPLIGVSLSETSVSPRVWKQMNLLPRYSQKLSIVTWPYVPMPTSFSSLRLITYAFYQLARRLSTVNKIVWETEITFT